MKYKSAMIDLETLGQRPGCIILSLGAVMFDPETKILGPEFYSVISRASCVDAGMFAEHETVAWWERQSAEARTVLTEAESSDAPSIKLVCQAFGGFLKQHSVDLKDRWVWGNGASFDAPILSEAYRLTEVSRPWMFWGDQCYRTIKNLNPSIKMEKSGVQHNALADAKQQALHLINLLTSAK